MQLKDKVAVVTGSSSGIGKGIALEFAREGAAVVVNYHSHPEGAEEVVSSISDGGGQAVAVQADVSRADDVQKLVDAAVQQFGGLDVMVNNAGIEKKVPFLDTPLDLWNEVIGVNLTGPFLGCQIAARQMVKQGRGGRIINISSIHEDMTMPTNAPYCASKGGLRMLMRTIAVELAPHGITVNNIAPGAIATAIDAASRADPKKMETLLDQIPMHRMGTPEEVGRMAVYLASDDSKYVTGATLFIDGGMIRYATPL